MTPDDLQRYLHEHIPISSAMGVTVREAGTDRVILEAPLTPNINHRETVFGGSASAVAILAAWSILHLRLRAAGTAPRLVIRRSEMSWDAPIAGPFTASADAPEDAAWDRFLRGLARRSMARITVRATLAFEGTIAGRLNGEFVALGERATATDCRT